MINREVIWLLEPSKECYLAILPNYSQAVCNHKLPLFVNHDKYNSYLSGNIFMAKFMLIRPLWIIRNYILRILNYPSIGARALVVKDDEVLLIRHTYEGGWYTIGGAVERRETYSQAVIRELQEEVGVTPAEPPILFGIYFNIYFGRDDYIAFYIVKEFRIEEAHSHEIAEQKWFKFTDLPENISPATRRRIEEYLGQREKSERW